MLKAMPYLKKVQNEELKIKLQEFGFYLIKSGQKFVKKRQRLTQHNVRKL